MSIWKIAWRSIQERSLSSSLTALSLALGVALVVAVLVIHGTVRDSFTQSAQGFDLIVGAKGGKLQLVLNTIYHLSQPIENIPWSYFQEFRRGKFAPMVAQVVPICLGDNFQGYRVVGTERTLFENQEYAPGRKYAFASGRNFESEHFFEAVVGSLVARRCGLKVGDSFEPTHGISTAEGQGHKHDAFEVVGILEPTGTPNDRALFVNVEGFFLLEGHAKPAAGPPEAEPPPTEAADHEHAHDEHSHDEHSHDEHSHDEHGPDPSHDQGHGHPEPATPAPAAEHDLDHNHAQDHESEHDHEHPHEDEPAHDHDHDHDHAHDHAHGHEHHEPLPEDQREVTALLVRSASPLYAPGLHQAVNEGNVAQAVFPVREVATLFEGLVGNVQLLLLALAAMVVVVSALGMMVAIYNTMSDRRREIGIMRALGAQRSTILWIILCESVLLSLAGGVLGLVLGHGGIALLSPWVEAQTGVGLGFLQFEPGELTLIVALVGLASLVGLVPAVAAYRTDVSRALSSAP